MSDVVLFGHSTCPPCLAIKDFLITNNVFFDYVDVYENQELAITHDIRSVPVVFINGNRFDNPSVVIVKQFLLELGVLK